MHCVKNFDDERLIRRCPLQNHFEYVINLLMTCRPSLKLVNNRRHIVNLSYFTVSFLPCKMIILQISMLLIVCTSNRNFLKYSAFFLKLTFVLGGWFGNKSIFNDRFWFSNVSSHIDSAKFKTSSESFCWNGRNSAWYGKFYSAQC